MPVTKGAKKGGTSTQGAESQEASENAPVVLKPIDSATALTVLAAIIGIHDTISETNSKIAENVTQMTAYKKSLKIASQDAMKNAEKIATLNEQIANLERQNAALAKDIETQRRTIIEKHAPKWQRAGYVWPPPGPTAVPRFGPPSLYHRNYDALIEELLELLSQKYDGVEKIDFLQEKAPALKTSVSAPRSEALVAFYLNYLTKLDKFSSLISGLTAASTQITPDTAGTAKVFKMSMNRPEAAAYIPSVWQDFSKSLAENVGFFPITLRPGTLRDLGVNDCYGNMCRVEGGVESGVSIKIDEIKKHVLEHGPLSDFCAASSWLFGVCFDQKFNFLQIYPNTPALPFANAVFETFAATAGKETPALGPNAAAAMPTHNALPLLWDMTHIVVLSAKPTPICPESTLWQQTVDSLTQANSLNTAIVTAYMCLGRAQWEVYRESKATYPDYLMESQLRGGSVVSTTSAALRVGKDGGSVQRPMARTRQPTADEDFGKPVKPKLLGHLGLVVPPNAVDLEKIDNDNGEDDGNAEICIVVEMSDKVRRKKAACGVKDPMGVPIQPQVTSPLASGSPAGAGHHGPLSPNGANPNGAAGGAVPLQCVSDVVEATPHEFQFSREVVLTLPLCTEKMPPIAIAPGSYVSKDSEKDLVSVYHLPQGKEEWVGLPSKLDMGQVSVAVKSFGLFQAFTRVTELPVFVFVFVLDLDMYDQTQNLWQGELYLCPRGFTQPEAKANPDGPFKIKAGTQFGEIVARMIGGVNNLKSVPLYCASSLLFDGTPMRIPFQVQLGDGAEALQLTGLSDSEGDNVVLRTRIYHLTHRQEPQGSPTKPKADSYVAFISYRVASDARTSQTLYDKVRQKTVEKMTKQDPEFLQALEHPRYAAIRNCKVFLDAYCLNHGDPWVDGFVAGLSHCWIFVPLLSWNAENFGSVAQLTTLLQTDRVDSVLLELELALELNKCGKIQVIYPLLYGGIVSTSEREGTERFSSYPYAQMSQVPNIVSEKTKAKAAEYLARLHVTPSDAFASRTIRDTVQAVLDLPSIQLWKMGEVDYAMEAASEILAKKIMAQHSFMVKTSQAMFGL